MGGGLNFKGYSDMCESPLPQRPLLLIDGGGKPYPYVLTLKGKPLGRNPIRVNPYVVTLLWIRTVDANENDSHSY